MSSDEENFQRRVKRKQKQIRYSDDSDSDSEPVIQRRCRSGRVYVSDSEINSTLQTQCNNLTMSDEDKVTRLQVWSEGDERSEESGDFSDELSDADQFDSNSDQEEEESGDENDTSKADVSSISSDSDSGPDGNNEKCPVCLSKFKSQEIGTPESCDHTFCLECILEWSKKVTTCPIDRQQYSLIFVREKPESKIIRRIPVKTVEENLGLPAAVETELHILTVCEVCGLGDREDRLLLCDGCDRGYHCDCLIPTLDEVPIEEWFCPDCAGQFNEEVSEIEGSGRSNQRLASSMEPVIRRVIARTRASESVIRRVNRNRSERGINSRATKRTPTTKKTRKRKTVRRRKSTKKKTVNSTLKKCKSGGVTKTKTKRRRRKKRRVRSKRRVKSLKKGSKYVKVPSIRNSIAKKIGIHKSRGPAHALPKIKKTVQDKNSSCSLSMFGDSNDVTNYSDYESLELEECYYDEDISVNGVGIMGSASTRTSNARQLVKKGLLSIDAPSTSGVSSTRRCVSSSSSWERGVNSGPVDILGDILKDQSVLHSASQDVLVKSDGSLKSKVTSVTKVKFPTSLQHNANKNVGTNSKKAVSNSVSSSQSITSNSRGLSTTVQNSSISSNSNQAHSSHSRSSKASTSLNVERNHNDDNVPDSTVSITNLNKKKKKKVTSEEEEVSLYSDIEDEPEDGEIREYESLFQISNAQDKNSYYPDVEPSYSPIVDISDDDLVIDESKEVASQAENTLDLNMLPTKEVKDDALSSGTANPSEKSLIESVNTGEKRHSGKPTNERYSCKNENSNNTNDIRPSTSIRCETSLELEGISETDEEVHQSDSDSLPIPVPTDMDFQLCKDNVFESPNIENSNAEMLDIQNMLSPVSAAGSSKESSYDGSQGEEDLIIREKTHPGESFCAKSFEEDSNNVNWKKLSRSTKVRSYRDRKPKDKQTYFQDREIKRKRRIQANINPNYVCTSRQYSAQSASVMRERNNRELDRGIENRRRRSRRERSRYSHDIPERSESHDRVRRFSKLRMDEVAQELHSSSSDNRKHRHKHRHHHRVQKAFQDHSNRSQEKSKRKRKHARSDEEKPQRRKQTRRISHSPRKSASESIRKAHRAALEKEVIASGNNITIKVNFDSNECGETVSEEVNRKNNSAERELNDVNKGRAILLNEEEEIIILSSPSSSNCSVYTVEDSEPERIYTSPLDLDVSTSSGDEVETSLYVQQVDGKTEVRTVLVEENTDESDSGPGSLKIVLSCDSLEDKTEKVLPVSETEELPQVSQNSTEDKSMVEEYDPFEPTNSPSTEQIEEVSKAPPLPELPPLPPEPPEENSIKPALPSFQEKPLELPPMNRLPNCPANWQIPCPLPPAPMPPPIMRPPPTAGNNIMMPPMDSSMFSRPPPTHISTPIRIIPPAVLPSAPLPPPPLLPELPHQLNVPPPNLGQNIPLKPPPNFNASPLSKPLLPYQKPQKDKYHQIAEDVTDVVDMELETSPYSNEGNNLQKSPARLVTQSSKFDSKTKITPLKITNDLKIDSFLLSLVTNKQILNTLAKKGASVESTSKQKTHLRDDTFSDRLKSTSREKRKHMPSKSPRKTGPRTPESDTHEPQFDDFFEFDDLAHNSSSCVVNTNDKRKHKSGKQFLFTSSSLPLRSSDDYKKGVKIGEDKLRIIDDVPNSAVEMQVKEKFLKKLNRQERVIEEVKLALKPHYHKRDIGKDDYKEIMRKTVPKICHNKAGEINPLRIKSLIEGYVKKCKHQRKKRSTLPSSTT